MERTELVKRIYDASHLVGSFTLRSGATTTEYFDKYQFESDPELLAEVAHHALPLVPTEIDALAGLELGGIPVVTALSALSGLPAVFVRKKAKDYGTAKLAEGHDVAGQRLVVIEDVVTSGGQILDSVTELRGLGAVIDHALCVIDRQAGGSEALHASGVELRCLFTWAELTDGANAGATP